MYLSRKHKAETQVPWKEIYRRDWIWATGVQGSLKRKKIYKLWQNWKHHKKDKTMWKYIREIENKNNKPRNNKMEIYE